MLYAGYIKQVASEMGFDLCGITPVRHLADNEMWLKEWLEKGYHASMEYMERNIEKRTDPSKLVEGAQTAVVCAVSYKNIVGDGYPENHKTKIASYACSADYHITIKGMLLEVFDKLKATYPTLDGRAFVDSAPLLEKQLAVEAGLGWIGRQSLLITPQYGSYVLLGELLLTAEADSYDKPFEGSRCGRCNNCTESCPAGAIVAPKTVDVRRCISRHTKEKESVGGVELDGWIFGCDACQSCCPYNRNAPMHTNSAFDMVFNPLEISGEEWLAMGESDFQIRFSGTTLVQNGVERVKQNIFMH